MNELLLGPQFVEETKLMKESNGEFATGIIAQKKTTDPDQVLLIYQVLKQTEDYYYIKSRC